MADGQGASMALPVWGNYMKAVYDDTEIGYDKAKGFDIPSWFNPNAGCN
jgi:penicillin-binding protein 1A